MRRILWFVLTLTISLRGEALPPGFVSVHVYCKLQDSSNHIFTGDCLFPQPKGEKGDPGPAGPSGKNGINGKDGMPGSQGPPGQDLRTKRQNWFAFTGGFLNLDEITQISTGHVNGNVSLVVHASPDIVLTGSDESHLQQRLAKLDNWFLYGTTPNVKWVNTDRVRVVNSSDPQGVLTLTLIPTDSHSLRLSSAKSEDAPITVTGADAQRLSALLEAM